MQCLVVFCLKTQDTQQVMIEILTVNALINHRVKLCRLMRCQHLGIGKRTGEIFLRQLLTIIYVRKFGGIDITQHTTIDSRHGRIGLLSLCRLIIECCQHRLQRIGRKMHLNERAHQLRLQQMTVLLLFLCLVDNLLKHIDFRLRQIFVDGVLYLFPQGIVCLCIHEQWHDQANLYK